MVCFPEKVSRRIHTYETVIYKDISRVLKNKVFPKKRGRMKLNKRKVGNNIN